MQLCGRQYAAPPRPKILRSNCFVACITQVLIYIRRINPVGFTFIIEILKQVLPGEFCTTADNIGQLCINNFNLSMLATFASKIEQDMGSLNFDMFVLKRRRTVRSVGFCIGLIANTQVPLVQQ